jgi:hypothetical protein
MVITEPTAHAATAAAVEPGEDRTVDDLCISRWITGPRCG